MAVPDYQELATLGDFLRLGLPPAALRMARTTHAPVTPSGAGGGVLVLQGELDVAALEAETLAGQLRIVVGGAVGVATWQWSADAGATWSTAATTAQGAKLVLPTGIETGVRAHFAGTLVASALYTWTSVSCVATCRRAANEEAIGELQRRYTFPLDPVPTNIARDVCNVLAADVMAVTGYNPNDGGNDLFEKRAKGARDRLKDMKTQETQPRTGVAKERAPRVSTGPRR